MKKNNQSVKVMFINSMRDESRVAIIKDNILTELSVEQTFGSNTKGNIYRGKVVQIQESLHAAFIEYGEKRHGFLSIDDIDFDMYPLLGNNPDKRTMKSRLKTGQSVMVQVMREPNESKGAALTTFISLPGMNLVFCPQKGEGGISKKILKDEERERLKSFISGIATENNSIVVRTGGIGKNLNDLKKEYVNLKKEWEQILTDYQSTDRPGLVYSEESNTVRMIRDYYTDDIENIWIDNPEIFHNIHRYFRTFLPTSINKLKLYMGEKTIFSNFGIEKQIENLSDSKILLPSGGSIVVQQTEALVSIDVNSGWSNQEGFSQKTAFRTNIEAADEIARQLRLRNLAGLIVIDFIDMKTAEERSDVEKALKAGMKEDKASHNLGQISQFGLMELSRQRLSQGYAATLEDKCPYCRGTGREPNQITYSNNILRKIKNIASEKKDTSITTTVPSKMAIYILNHKRRDLFDIETEFNVAITINSSNDLNNTEDIKFQTEKVAGLENDTKPKRTDGQQLAEQTEVSQARKKGKYAESGKDTQKTPAHKQTAQKSTPSKPEKEQSFSHKKPEFQQRNITEVATAGEPISPSCVMDNLPEIDPIKSGLMDEFYGNVGGRHKGKSVIFYDSKYVMESPNESSFFEDKIPKIDIPKDVDAWDEPADNETGMSELSDGEQSLLPNDLNKEDEKIKTDKSASAKTKKTKSVPTEPKQEKAGKKQTEPSSSKAKVKTTDAETKKGNVTKGAEVKNESKSKSSANIKEAVKSVAKTPQTKKESPAKTTVRKTSGKKPERKSSGKKSEKKT